MAISCTRPKVSTRDSSFATACEILRCTSESSGRASTETRRSRRSLRSRRKSSIRSAPRCLVGSQVSGQWPPSSSAPAQPISHSRLPSTTRRSLTAWTFQTPDGSFLRNQKGGTSALSIEIHLPPFGLFNEEGALGWSPSTRAGLLGTGAMLPCPHAPMAGSPRRQRPRARRGAEFGRSTSVGPPSRASPSSWGRSRACTDLAGRARVPAGGEMEVPFHALRIFSKVPKQRDTETVSKVSIWGSGRDHPQSVSHVICIGGVP